MRLRVSRTDHAFGPGVAELMEHVEATGSLSKGCKCMQMAYSKGWKILKRAEEDLGIRLLSPNLHLLTAGGAVKKPTEIIERLVESPLIERLKRSFDIVILDTPPASFFPDALLLAPHPAEVVYVTRFYTLRRRVVKKTLAKFDNTGAYVLGIVLNQLPHSRVLSYGYEGYGAYEKEYYKAYGERGAKSQA